MTYYLVNAVFLVALVVTSVSVILMRRELKRLRTHHQVYASALDETGDALIKVGSLIRDLNLQGLNTVHQLIGQIETARSVLAELQQAQKGLASEDTLSTTKIRPDHRKAG